MRVLENQTSKSSGCLYNLHLQKKVVGFTFTGRCHDLEMKCLQTQNIGEKRFIKLHGKTLAPNRKLSRVLTL